MFAPELVGTRLSLQVSRSSPPETDWRPARANEIGPNEVDDEQKGRAEYIQENLQKHGMGRGQDEE